MISWFHLQARGRRSWLEADRPLYACGLTLWWINSDPGHKGLMAAGIMQWHARRLSPFLPSFIHSPPSNRGWGGGSAAERGIPARFNQIHLNAALLMLSHKRGNKTWILLHSEASPFTGASYLPGTGRGCWKPKLSRVWQHRHGVWPEKTSTDDIKTSLTQVQHLLQKDVLVCNRDPTRVLILNTHIQDLVLLVRIHRKEGHV